MNLQDLFTATTLSAAINKLPVLPTKAGSLGIFNERGIATTTVVIEVRNGRLFLVPNVSRNDDPQPVANGKRTRRTFETAHLPVSSQLLPSEIQNLAQFGEDSEDGPVDPQAQVINDKLQALKNSLEATREWQRIGALRGKVLDADGGVLVDLYDEFGVAQKKISVALNTANADVRGKVLAAKRHAEEKLGGVLVNGFKAFCGPEWFDKFTDHAKVKEAYANYQEASDRLGGDNRQGFMFGGVEFIEYNAKVSGQTFIPDDVAQVFPVGMGMYELYNAPANYNETVNTLGQPFYAKAEERRLGKGWDLEAQANPLALCLVPEALVELKIG